MEVETQQENQMSKISTTRTESYSFRKPATFISPAKTVTVTTNRRR